MTFVTFFQMYITQCFFLCPLAIYLEIILQVKKHSGVKLWRPDKADQFRSNIDVQAVKSIENYLNEICNSPAISAVTILIR